MRECMVDSEISGFGAEKNCAEDLHAWVICLGVWIWICYWLKKITYPVLHGKLKEPRWALMVYSIWWTGGRGRRDFRNKETPGPHVSSQWEWSKDTSLPPPQTSYTHHLASIYSACRTPALIAGSPLTPHVSHLKKPQIPSFRHILSNSWNGVFSGAHRPLSSDIPLPPASLSCCSHMDHLWGHASLIVFSSGSTFSSHSPGGGTHILFNLCYYFHASLLSSLKSPALSILSSNYSSCCLSMDHHLLPWVTHPHFQNIVCPSSLALSPKWLCSILSDVNTI